MIKPYSQQLQLLLMFFLVVNVTMISVTFIEGKLIALNKMAGGIRPVVIGYTLRRLATKCATSYACEK